MSGTAENLIRAAGLSGADAQEVRDFCRFLQLGWKPGERFVADWRWIAYAKGEMGAPPLLWEGDNA